MNEIVLERLKITIDTESGMFGSDITFEKGLNILRAKNTKGKSSTLNSILYVMGLEEILGGKNAKTMKPVLKEKLLYKDKEIPILESKVELEISNQKEETITLVRWIKSSSIDEKLIRVYYGSRISNTGKFDFSDFYVHMKGAAIDKSGFHKFLSSFLGWQLPKVPAFEGGDRLLYIQSLFPLMFVEQRKGWSSFYSPMSGSFGIRDLSKRAFEFLLDMDVTKNAKEKESLKIEKALLINKWKDLKDEIEELAESINAEIPNLPEKPILLDELSLNVYDENKLQVLLIDRIFQLESSIKLRDNLGITRVSEVTKEYEEKAKKQELIVLTLQNEISSIRKDIHLEKNNFQIMEGNLHNLEVDLKRNQEAEKLYKLGSNIDTNISKGVCPTCNQPVEDSLLPSETNIQPLDITENIRFIKEQINTLKFGIKQSQLVIKKKQSKLAVNIEHLDRARNELRLYKSELNDNPKLPTKIELEKLVELKVQLNNLQKANKSFEKLLQNYEDIKKGWKKYLGRLEALPKDYFSGLDKRKLKYFEREFLNLLRNFRFSSIQNIGDINISLDKYTPTVKGFDIKFDSSASDNIRLIWSYIISIYKTSVEYSGNHPGLIVFDEPGQQQMADFSQKKLFEVLSKINGQSVIGSSLEPNELKKLTENINLNVVDLGDEYIIKPLI